MSMESFMQEKIQKVDIALDEYIKDTGHHHKLVFEAMRYSIFAGGKRLRPVLMLAANEYVGGKEEEVLPFACAIEMIHTYSLIHDDLPAMDDDDYRRGKLTNHKVFGEGIAILAGDGLLNLAYEIMFKEIWNADEMSMKRKAAAAFEIVAAAGVNGMIGGQVVDLISENKKINSDILDFIHNNKTAALIIASIKAGAIIGGASDKEIQEMTEYGKNIGLGFQITDDILDIIGDEKKLGKKVGSDLEKHKATYPSIHGMEASIEKVKELHQKSVAVFHNQKDKARFFLDMADFLVKREF
ncbi:MAG: polyprenyl synthetase family protein [Bacillota bacterium]